MKRAAWELLKAVLAVLGLNAACFLGEMVAYGTWYDGNRPARLYMDVEGKLPQLRPGVRLPGLVHDISVNQHGFRGPELEPKTSETVRLWCLGGSTTFDIYAPDDGSTWPALLAQELSARWGVPVDVVNAGIPGETLLGGLDRLQETTLEPDILVVYTGPNELAQGQMHVRDGGGGTEPPNLAALRVARRLIRLPPRTPDSFAGRTLSAEVLDKANRELRRLRQLGTDVVLVTHALWAQPEDTGELARQRVDVTSRLLKLSPEASIAALDAYNDVVRKVAQGERLGLVDLRTAIDGDDRWWGDSVHFSPEGSVRAAEVLADALESQHRPGRSAERRPDRPDRR